MALEPCSASIDNCRRVGWLNTWPWRPCCRWRAPAEDDTLFLDLTSDRYGQVVGFISGLPGWTGLHTRNMSGVLADDFDAYLNGLFIDPDLAEDLWSDHAHQDPADPWRRMIEQWLDDGPAWLVASAVGCQVTAATHSGMGSRLSAGDGGSSWCRG
jgi:hypothetical protein